MSKARCICPVGTSQIVCPACGPTKGEPGILFTTREYPCGCSASGPGDVPNYCPEHPTPVRGTA